jgi:uncharacterized protein YndB with AHSA1/START domain
MTQVIVRRTIAAPAEALFDAWLNPDSLAVWMRPRGVSHSEARVDPQVGGAFEIMMHNQEGPIRHSGTYQVIDRPNRLVFTWISLHTQQQESQVTVEFHAGNGTTEVVITHVQLPDDKAALAHFDGWGVILEALDQEARRTLT